MGSVGSTSKSNVIYIPQTERLDSYNYRDGQKADMKDALQRSQDAINDIMKEYRTLDVDGLYESLADWFPRSMDADDAEKVILADKEYITTVRFSIWDDRNGKLNVSLEPNSYSIDEFNDQELEDMGIYKEDLRDRRRK